MQRAKTRSLDDDERARSLGDATSDFRGRAHGTLEIETVNGKTSRLSSPADETGLCSVSIGRGVMCVTGMRFLLSYKQSLHVLLVGFIPIPIPGRMKDIEYGCVDIEVDTRYISRLNSGGGRIIVEGPRNATRTNLTGRWGNLGEEVKAVTITLDFAGRDAEKALSLLREKLLTPEYCLPLEKYRLKHRSKPDRVLDAHLGRLVRMGKTREAAILELTRQISAEGND